MENLLHPFHSPSKRKRDFHTHLKLPEGLGRSPIFGSLLPPLSFNNIFNLFQFEWVGANALHRNIYLGNDLPFSSPLCHSTANWLNEEPHIKLISHYHALNLQKSHAQYWSNHYADLSLAQLSKKNAGEHVQNATLHSWGLTDRQAWPTCFPAPHFSSRSGGYHTYFVTTSRTQLWRGKGTEIVKSLHSFLLPVAFNHETGENKHWSPL